jgi:RNA polymerase sigma factor (sigma-70 family)
MEAICVSEPDPPVVTPKAPPVGPVLSELSDSQLIDEFDSLARLAFVVCGDRSRAEDAAAEAISRVWQRSRHGDIDDLRPYLRRTLVNLLTRGSRRAVSERRALDSTRRAEVAERAVAEVVAERTDLRVALDRLAPKQSAVLALRYFEDLSDADIAATLQLRPGTVKSRASRGLAALRAIMEGHDGA